MIHYVVIKLDSRPDGTAIRDHARVRVPMERSVSNIYDAIQCMYTHCAGCDGDGIVESQHGPSRPLGSCRDEARSSSTGASSSLLTVHVAAMPSHSLAGETRLTEKQQCAYSRG